MFDLSFTRDDLKRTIWTFIQAGLAAALVVLTQQSKIPATWDEAEQVGIAVGIAFVAAVIAAVKNAVLADGSALK